MSFPADITSALNNVNVFLTGGQGTPRRIPMQLSSSYRKSRGVPPIKLSVNPQSVDFSQPKRITKRDTQAGSTFFHFSNEFGQNNDILTIRFSGVTGNIDTRSQTILGGNLPGGPKKLFNWADLYQLTREPIYDVATNRGVVFWITYHSPIFITGWTFLGFFNEVLNFSERAESPFMKDWNFSFVVQDTFPSLNNIADQIATTLQGLDTLGTVAGFVGRAITG